MACSSVEMPVFTESNLGTRVVVVVSPDSTTNDFKREFQRAHLNCFPEIGQIKVDAVSVKKKSCFYHLSETFPLKHVFQHRKKFRSLHVEACRYINLPQLDSSEYVDVKVISVPTKRKTCVTGTNPGKVKCRAKRKKARRFACLSALSNALKITHFSKMKERRRKKRNKARRKPQVVSKAISTLPTYECEGMEDEEHNCSLATGFGYEDLSDAISVSGIIGKYFSSPDEVNSSSRFSPDIPEKTPLPIPDLPLDNESSISKALRRNKSKTTDIGSHLVSASKSLGLTKFTTPRRCVPGSTFIQSVVFEMPSDEEEDSLSIVF